MAPKLISFDEEARRALERGMDQLANVVKMFKANAAARSEAAIIAAAKRLYRRVHG